MKKSIVTALLFLFYASCYSQVEIIPQLYSQSYITNATYSHSRKTIATAEYRVNRIEFMDARTKLKMGNMTTDGPVISLVVDSSGKYFVAGTERGIIYIINAETLAVKKKIDAGVKMGLYYVILNYMPLLFTNSSTFYFTGHVNEGSGEKIAVTEYYIYQYDIEKDILKRTGKSGSNKPFYFLFDKSKKTIAVVAEKLITVIDITSGLVKSETAIDHLNLNSFGGEYFFLDDSKNGRFGVLSSDRKDLNFYAIATGKKIDSLKDVYRFHKLQGDNLLYQSTDKKFYTANSKTKQKKLVTSDSIINLQWCSVILDFKQNVYGLVTRSGIGVINLNVSSITFPDVKGDPLPWGVFPTIHNTLLYATENSVFEFDYLMANLKREIGKFSEMVRRTIYIPSQNIVIVNTSGQNSSGRFVSDSIIAVNYSNSNIIWRYKVGPGGLNEMIVNYDSSRLLLLSGRSAIVELDIASGKELRRMSAQKTVYGVDYMGIVDGFYTGLTQGEVGKYCLEGLGENLKGFYYNCFEYNSPVRVFATDNTKKYAAVAYPEDGKFFVFPLNKDSAYKQVNSNARVLKFSNDNKWLAAGTFSGAYIRLYNFPSLTEYADIKCGVGKVFDIAFSADSKFLFAMLEDGYISVINITERKVVTEMILYGSNFLVKDTEGYYTANKSQVNEIGLRYGNRCYPVSNADIKYNRPDIIIRKMGVADTAILNAYDKAYKKRLKRMNADSSQLENITSFPEAIIPNSQFIANTSKESVLTIPVSFSSAGAFLRSFNIVINDVPLFGFNGIDLSARSLKSLDTSLAIRLTEGENIINAECTDINGIKSTRYELAVNCTKAMPSKTYFIGIGINEFNDATKNLSWSVKDIQNLASSFKQKDATTIVVDSLFNKNVTAGNIKKIKEQLLKTNVNDKIIIAYSGHGLLSKSYDYYLSTYAVNFDRPEEQGLPYEELESLLDSIPARRKLLLIDACHSGEVDKDEKLAMNKVADSLGLSKGIIIDEEGGKQQVGLQNSFELMRSLFVNMGTSTGAAIISAAAGNQFALERGDLKNGVFTYSILEAMRNYSSMSINTLKKVVGERVEQLTSGLQKPTSRSELTTADWRLW